MFKLQEIEITKKDFEDCQWYEVIKNCPKKLCEDYFDLFYEKAKESETNTRDLDQKVFILLGSLASLVIKINSKDEPLQHSFASAYSRSPTLSDFTDQQMTVLKEILPDIEDNEIKSRIADALWIRNRDYNVAQIAIESYLESAKLLIEPDDWVYCSDRLERAVQISKSINNNDLFLKAISQIEETIESCSDDRLLFLPANLMDLLLEYKQGDPTKYSILSKKAATYSESKKRGVSHFWDNGRRYWKIKAKWHDLENNLEEKKVALVNSAESYVKQALDDINEPIKSFTNASYRIKSAIEAYRQIGSMKERENELHDLLAIYQKESVKEMNKIERKIDISKEIANAKKIVQGKPITDALFSLAYYDPFIKVSDLREQTLEARKHFPAQFLFSTAIINNDGRTVGARPSALHNKQEEIDIAIEAEMARSASQYQAYFAQSTIEPARQQILYEHKIKMNDFIPLVSESPFIPTGRESFYIRGLYSGLQGDFLVSTHILIPQIEYSLRYVLNCRGITPTNLSSDGLQVEPTLNIIFERYNDVLVSIFGEEIIFYLKTLLIDRFGSNLRNLVAHGLLQYENFDSLICVYLWWFTLHLCSLRFVNKSQ